ncbi:iron complex outermembrane recepter protein [Halopseudomonas xinjiangensis]|uniref:Ferric aerobactin receptor n=1 Tax=Halopseudomonas xinjiangensis TaxID=487184 RepID=A0A1H1X0V2_9GAMM|nr:TonB-dependent receptor [Halopseudomonas xinjiangensis]SDT02985.1 iron complex outermembrane recepter protein [Halopseudomonas xinjiangensis]
MSPLRTPLMTAGFMLTSLAIAIPAQAVTTLDSTVVIGGRAATTISDIPGTAWVIESEQLHQQFRSGVTLKEALSQLVPGMDVASQGRTNYGQNMRGRGVLVMIDGVSLNSARNVSRQFDSIDPFNIERIEVLSGANAIYGGGATGGIINIVTKRGTSGDTRYELEAGVRSGFEDSDDRDIHAGAAVSGGGESWAGRLSLAGIDNGGSYDSDGEQVIFDITQTDLQYNRAIDLLGSLDFNLANGHVLRLNAQRYDSGFEGDKGVYFGPNLAALQPPFPDVVEIREGFESDLEPRTERTALSANYYVPDVFGHQLNLQTYFREEKLNFHPFPYVSRNYFSASEQDTTQAGFKAVLSRSVGDFAFNYGVDYEREKFEADQTLFDFPTAVNSGGLILDSTATVGRYPSFTTDGIAAFAQADWRATDRLLLTAGVRQQRYYLEVGDFVDANEQVRQALGLSSGADAIPGGENDYDTTLVNLGAVFTLQPGNQLWANVSQGYEIPDPGKYYGRGVYVTNGTYRELQESINVDEEPLKAIKSNQVELGWRMFRGNFDAQVAAYYLWSDESLSYNSSNLAVQVDDDKRRNYGLEGQLNYRLSDAWQVGTSAHYTRAELENDDGDWDKQAVTLASPSKVSAYIGWENAQNGVRLQSITSLDLEDEAGNELDGYTTLDLLTRHQLPVGELNFGIQNLLNRDYTTVWGQRSQLFYSSYAPANTFDYRGRGTTYSVSYNVAF